MKKKHIWFVAGIGLLLICSLSIGGGLLLWRFLKSDDQGGDPSGGQIVVEGEFELTNFADEQDFKDYLSEVEENMGFYGMGVGGGVDMRSEFDSPNMAMPEALDESASQGSQPDRYSETNVQVEGIDEPDIIKTDGNHIYFSSDMYDYYLPSPVMMEEPMIIDSTEEVPEGDTIKSQQNVKVIDAFPLEDLDQIAEIDTTGNLLLYKDILVVISYDSMTAYDVSDPSEPQQEWRYEIEDQSSLVEARLYEDDLYIINANYVDPSAPCPVRVISDGEQNISVPCRDIYYSKQNVVSADTVYSVLKMSVSTGEVKDKTSFVGGAMSGMTTIYMSENSIYVGYYYMGDIVAFMADFVSENDDLFPDWVVDKVEDLVDMDIGQMAKMTEFEEVMRKHTNSLGDDEGYEFENEVEDRMTDYYKENKRGLEKTGVVEVPIDNLQPENTGLVPGRLLNQFAMDEYEGNLRIATTVGDNFMFSMGAEASENDVYILDDDLEIKGYVQGMGLEERIYSVRFMGDVGYVVTFREIDPFYVLDLSDAGNPSIEGELKIPGFSSYLHPLKQDLILGVGEEDGRVKLSLFDVSDPSNPTEKDKYTMSDYWSEVGSNHHAFLQDPKYEVFFIPTGKGGNIFSYAGEEIELEKSISGYDIKRALFIDDYFYIVGSEGIKVIEAGSWVTVDSLDFN